MKLLSTKVGKALREVAVLRPTSRMGLTQRCESKCLTIGFEKEREALICSLCQFLWCKCSHNGSFQAVDTMSQNTSREVTQQPLVSGGVPVRTLLNGRKLLIVVFLLVLPSLLNCKHLENRLYLIIFIFQMS